MRAIIRNSCVNGASCFYYYLKQQPMTHDYKDQVVCLRSGIINIEVFTFYWKGRATLRMFP